MAYRYVDGEWVYVVDNPSDNSSNGGRPSDRPVVGGGTVATTPPPPLIDNSNRDTTESTNEATQEYIEIEDNILVGELAVLPNPFYKAKATVLLQYLGNNLTGLYFVDKVTHVFGKSGYEQTLTVSRNGFGSTIKSGNAGKPIDRVAPTTGALGGTGDTSRPPQATPPPTPPKSTTRYYTIVSGDTLWGIATRYYGNGAQYPKIYNANRSVISNPNLIYPGQKIVIP